MVIIRLYDIIIIIISGQQISQCCVCGCCTDLQSVTSIWTQSQHEQQTANALIHSPQSDDQSTRAGITDTSSIQQQSTAPPSIDGQQTRKKRKNIRQLLSNRVAPTTDVEEGGGMLMGVDRRRLDLPVYSKFLAGCSQTLAADCHPADDAGAEATGSSDAVCIESDHTDRMKSDSSVAGEEVDDDDDDSTVAAQSEYGLDKLSDNSPGVESETDVHSNSNYSIASSDTAALSIKLDENYDPVVEPVSDSVTKPKPPPAAKISAAKAVVRPLEARQSNIPVLHASASLPVTAVMSKSNSATQTSIDHPPLAYYQQPFPYPVFGYGGYLPPVPPMCETPIWPPFAYPPPLPWYYGGPHYDPMQFMPAAPPYCVVAPSATTASNSNHSSLPQQQCETARGTGDCQPTVTAELSKPTVIPPSSLREPATTTSEKLFRPIATRSCFQPTAGSLFKPVTNSENGGRQQISRSEPVTDEKLSRSLLEMVELITPQFDSGTEPASDNSQADDDAEDEAEREAWEAEERERQRIRRRHTRQWMRALRTDIDHTQFSDTSV